MLLLVLKNTVYINLTSRGYGERDYFKPIEEVRQAVGESFKQYINEIREADLQPKLN